MLKLSIFSPGPDDCKRRRAMNVDDLLEAFEESWNSSHKPCIEGFLEQHSLTPPLDRELVSELVKVDLHRSWGRSFTNSHTTDGIQRPQLTEDYALRFPEITHSPDYPYDILTEELLARLGARDEVNSEELSRRFPNGDPERLAETMTSARKYHVQHRVTSDEHNTDSPVAYTERFAVQRSLGQGGMGQVFLAVDPRLQRQVAIKVPLRNLVADPEARARFLREGRAAGSISHPNIVAVYETGDNDDGCYIVFEYVDGISLKQWIKQHPSRISNDAFADLVRILALAIQAAHECGITHRDLKPENILLEFAEASGSSASSATTCVRLDGVLYRPRITDFGLAGLTQATSDLTVTGTILGTAAYMSPEQVDGRVAPQSDVFSLGVILYELLTGESPFACETYVGTIDRVRKHDPVPPCRRSSSVHRDLSAICECALRKDLSSRYSSAQHLADDLAKFLKGEPISARRIGPVGRTNRWVRRNPLATALIMVICFSLLVSITQNQRLEKSLNQSEQLRSEARDINQKYRSQVYAQDMKSAFDAWQIRSTTDVEQLLQRQLPSDEYNERGFEWHLLSALAEREEPLPFDGHTDIVADMVVSHSTKTLVSVGVDRTIRCWDLSTGVQREAPVKTRGPIRALALANDGSSFWSGTNLIQSRHVSNGKLRTPIPLGRHTYGIRAIAVSKQGLVASNSHHHDIQLNSPKLGGYRKWDLGVPSLYATRFDFSPDGDRFYFTRRKPAEVVEWEIESESPRPLIRRPAENYFGPLDMADSGEFLAVGTLECLQLLGAGADVWTTRTANTHSKVRDVEISPDNRFVACGLDDGALSIFNVATVKKADRQTPSHSLNFANSAIYCVAWLDNQHVFTGDADGRILLHEIPDPVETLSRIQASHRPEFVHNADWIAFTNSENHPEIRDASTGELIAEMKSLELDSVKSAEVDATQTRLVLMNDRRFAVWNLPESKVEKDITCQLVEPAPMRDFTLMGLTITDDGRYLAVRTTADNYCQLWDLKSPKDQWMRSIRLDAPCDAMAFSPNGKKLFLGTRARGYVHDLPTNKTEVATDQPVRNCDWLSNDRVIFDTKLKIGILDIEGKSERVDFDTVGHSTIQFQVSSDGKTLMSSGDSTMSFWHIPTGRFLGAPELDGTEFRISTNADALYYFGHDSNPYELRRIKPSDQKRN